MHRPSGRSGERSGYCSKNVASGCGMRRETPVVELPLLQEEFIPEPVHF